MDTNTDEAIGTTPEIAPWTWWADHYQIPQETLRALHGVGRGPKMFPIGKRLYILRTDWHAWIARVAEAGGVTVVNEPRRRNPARQVSPTQDPPPRRRGRPLKFGA